MVGTTCFSRKKCVKQATLFKEKGSSVGDEDRLGRLAELKSTEVSKQSVNDLIQSDRRVTVDGIAMALTLSISVAAAHKIVHDDLGYSKVSCRWMPKMPISKAHTQEGQVVPAVSLLL